MRSLALTAALLATLPPLAAGAATEDGPVVVWVATRGVAEDAFPIAAGWVEELRILVVREEVDAPLDPLEAERTLLAHRAIAVAWHDAEGQLRVLIAADSGPELVAAPGGGTTEEGLYLRELLAQRIASGPNLAAALVTVPDEIVSSRAGPRPPAAPPRPAPMAERSSRAPARGVKIGAGYSATAHFDEVVWWQHGIRFLVPSMRLAELVELTLLLDLGLPASVGAEGETWLELRSVGVYASISTFPLRRRFVEIEVAASIGPTYTEATAYLPNGESDHAGSTSGLASVGVALVVHPAAHVDLRLRGEARYAIRPTAYGIGGQGDFGGGPWQPSVALEVAFALFRSQGG